MAHSQDRASVGTQEVLALEPAIIAIGVIAAIWVITKTARAIRILREQRRDSGSSGRSDGYGNGYGAGGIDPGGSSHGGCDGHGGGDSGGHGGW
jgi:hypothetical protein